MRLKVEILQEMAIDLDVNKYFVVALTEVLMEMSDRIEDLERRVGSVENGMRPDSDMSIG